MEAHYSLRQQGWMCDRYPHCDHEMTTQQAKRLLSGGYFIRNSFDWDCQNETQFWYVIKDTFGGIEELPSKVRNQVRKSLRCYEVRMVSSDEMAHDGFELFNLSRKRFGDDSLLVTREQWDKRCYGAGQDLWLAYDRETGKAQALAFNRRYEDYCSYVTMGVNPDAPGSTYPMYGLVYRMNEYYLQEQGLKYVLDGARSVTEHSNIQPFLEEKFRFRKAYCHIRLFYKPLIGCAVNMLFPMRRWIKHPKIQAVLRQEAWKRNLAR